MSGRRDSRVHITERQNDALLEFENFKRKYLLVNKHITKLNSTLSVRVEELNVQLSTLYSENLRLRASEVALKTQLKKERQRSQKIFVQTEHAVGALMAQLSGFRASTEDLTEESHTPVSTRRKTFSPVQPPREIIRLARAPADLITQIHESEEDDADDDDVPTRTITSRRPSMSRLPLPKHTSCHHPPTTTVDVLDEKERPKNIDLDVMMNTSNKRKLGRRNSSLFVADPIPDGAVVVQRAPSPVVDGPFKRPRRRMLNERRSSLEEDEEHEIEQQIESDLDPEVILPSLGREVQPPISQDTDPTAINGTEVPHPDPPESKPPVFKPKPTKAALEIRQDSEPQSTSERESNDSKDRRRMVIKDVTNSPRRSPADLSERLNEKSGLSRMTSPTPDTGLLDALTPKPMSTPLSSALSTPATENGAENGFEATNQNTGRERRTRKTLNYAEPKLNTKMRKPSPPPGSERPRTSGGGVTIRRRRSANPALVSDEDGDDADVEGAISIKNTGRRKTVHSAVTSHESLPISIGTVDTDELESRRRSLAVW